MEDCPYIEGAEFTVLFRPEYLDSTSDTSLKSPIPLCFKVLKTYTFTESAAMKVVITSSPIPPGLPPILFWKVYDRRFVDERWEASGKYSWKRWNHEKEEKAKQELLYQLVRFHRTAPAQGKDETESWSSVELETTDEILRDFQDEDDRKGQDEARASPSEAELDAAVNLENGKARKSTKDDFVEEDLKQNSE